MREPTMRVEERLRELGIALPLLPEPAGTCVDVVRTGNRIFLSGVVPVLVPGVSCGRRSAEAPGLDSMRRAVRLATLNALLVARTLLGSLDRVQRIVRIGVYIATAGETGGLSHAAEIAPALLTQLFGGAAGPSRLAIDVATLPLGGSVELELTLEVEP